MNSGQWLQELYEANKARIYRLAENRLRAYTGSAADAQDVLQEVFLLAEEKNIRNHPNPEGWLVITAIHLCRNYGRATARNREKQRRNAQAKYEGNVHHSLLFSSLGEEKYRETELLLLMEQVLLPEEILLIRQYCIEEKSVDEIAESLGISPNAVRVRVFRVRNKLKKYT